MKILISGSSSGIGRAITEKLLDQGHTVVGLARNHQKFQPAVERYIPYSVDFSKTKELPHGLNQIYRNHPLIDIIICSAGYGQFGELEQFSYTDMQRLMDVNFLSQAMLIKTWLPTMKKQNSGKVIVVGSEAALQGTSKGSLYCASKFALRGFCQSLRAECKRSSIAVSLINPGFVQTPFFNTLSFKPGDDPSHAISTTQLVKTIQFILETPSECVIEEINLQPLNKVFTK